MDNRQTAWQTITRGSCEGKGWKPHSSRPILIYFECRSKPLLITVICVDPHLPHKLLETKYCFLIPGDDTSFFFFISFFFGFMLFYVIISFYKNYYYYYYYYYCYYYLFIYLFYFIFWWKLFFIFSCAGMLRDFPECSGMFRNVPCSGFYRRPEVTDCNIFQETFKSILFCVFF